MILSSINIRKVTRKMLKTSGFALGFQHLPRDLANVNEARGFQHLPRDLANVNGIFNNWRNHFQLLREKRVVYLQHGFRRCILL